MIPVRGYEGATIAVLGLGRSGLTAARALRAGGAEVIAWDDGAKGREAAEAEGFTLRELSKPGALDGVATLITSPGIPHLYPAPHPAIAAAWRAGVAVDNDVGLFFRSLGWDDSAPRVVAITGSNGKSTTSALLHHILVEAGKRAHLAGNIGRGVLDLDPPEEDEIIVLELSSYQTELARSLTPDVAVFTNLSPDHLDRHAGFGGYFAAKRRLFAEGGPDRAVIGVDENEGLFLANQLQEAAVDDRVIRVASGKLEGPGWTVTARKGWLAETRKGRQVASVDLRDIAGLPGKHNHQNACCAWAAARSLGLGPREIEAGLRSYPGLPHRSQRIAERAGVAYVNDSKATNVDAAVQALQAFERIRWICGGLQKEGGLEALHPHLSCVAKAYVIGREAAGFALGLGQGVEVEVCGDMATAVAAAARDAQPGETVLLAPAAASFDQYDSFERRGEDFAARVAALD
ncbi:UDP-N-acetylmuramoyl-L-alanine--D-glutamate ligase [Jannaschia seohaensis]|uniref:UDP-N-acetylmuramoylalanine--D-glutamate ligase n=1 Tax=Jannaschia seohaensis TaxID=475081 RepID=A0A2Y9C300_9RHOB|nr:UDP-N-acetylmuramoyl-L-alanine--D-glutamate ligase [Jannaschia seohaensis]PWJ13286.1 UDP-N-acetylmuramoylalanine--D-glutamate ligase [Jannaschia seohaensis]SSA50612.1 UDP-N-acetylmuramoylalanine--D-glutamate ligase [Jannaschia seohaensis]